MTPILDLEEAYQLWAEKVKQGLIEVPENGEEHGLEFSMAELLKEMRHDTAD